MRSTKPFLAVAAAAVLTAAAACADGGVAPEAAGARAILQSTNQPPVAAFTLTNLGLAFCGPGACAYNYRYDGSSSYDPDGSIASYAWRENGVTVRSTSTRSVTAVRAYRDCEGGIQEGWLVVTDNAGAQDSVCYSYSPVP
jgi:hypothetical protein